MLMKPARVPYRRLAAGLAALLCVSCFGSWGRPSKPPGSAVWVNDPSALVGLDVATLPARGLNEVFLEAGTLEWQGASPHVKIQTLPAIGRAIRVTLVVAGAWPVELGDSKAAGSRLASEIQRLDLDAQARGIFAAGVHLDLDATGNLTSYAQGLRATRSDLGKNLALSASVNRAWLGDEALGKVARAVDYIVAFLYGQRPAEIEDTAAWDFQQVALNLQKVEALKCPYMIGAATVGTTTHLGARGEALATSTEIALHDLVERPGLRLQGGFTLEGIDRAVYGFQAERPLNVGPWDLARGESVRVVGTSPSYLYALRKRAAEVATARHLGELFYRLPRANESLALTAAELGDALATTPPTLDLAISAELVERNAQRWLVKVVLEKRNDERSDIALLNNNFIEITCDDALVGAVQLGQFQRLELLRKGSDAVDIAALRNPERARLYLPILEAGHRFETGPIEIKPKSRDAKITLDASFLTPDGQTVNAPSVVWTPPAK